MNKTTDKNNKKKLVKYAKKIIGIFIDFRDPRDPGYFSKIPGTGFQNICAKIPGIFFSWDGKSRQKATSGCNRLDG